MNVEQLKRLGSALWTAGPLLGAGHYAVTGDFSTALGSALFYTYVGAAAWATFAAYTEIFLGLPYTPPVSPGTHAAEGFGAIVGLLTTVVTIIVAVVLACIGEWCLAAASVASVVGGALVGFALAKNGEAGWKPAAQAVSYAAD